MEQKIPKHRPGSLRYFAEHRKVSHTTVRRLERCEHATFGLGSVLGYGVTDAVLDKRIRIGQEPLWMWYCIARKEPAAAWHIYQELDRNPTIPLWQRNGFIRMIERELDACAYVREHQHELDAEDEASFNASVEKWEQQKAEQKAEPESSAPAEATNHPHLSDEELAKVKAWVDDELRKRGRTD